VKLGAAQVIPGDLSQLTPGPVALAAALGFDGLAWSTGNGVGSDRKNWKWLKSLADMYGMSVCEVGVYSTNFLTDDDAVVNHWLDRVREGCEAAQFLVSDSGELPTAVIGCGSHNPAGGWFWDRRNFSEETRKNLVVNLGRVGKIGEAMGVNIALEGHINVTACSGRVAAEIIREAGSSALRVHLDPVNWMTLGECYDSIGFLESLFEDVGSLAGSCHAKDAAVLDELITRVVECPPGDGCLDYPTFVRLANQLGPNQWMVIEHLPLDALAAAKNYVDRAIKTALGTR
jgi:sugar phosphate isomerase/epimerase